MIILAILSFVLFSFVVVLTYTLLRSLKQIQIMTEDNEEAIKVINDVSRPLRTCYEQLYRATNANVMYDDPEVKRIVASMKACKDAVDNAISRLDFLKTDLKDTSDDTKN